MSPQTVLENDLIPPARLFLLERSELENKIQEDRTSYWRKRYQRKWTVTSISYILQQYILNLTREVTVCMMIIHPVFNKNTFIRTMYKTEFLSKIRII